VALLGLAFKQDTDDMRESPALVMAGELVKRGARLRVWDPEAMREARWRLADLGDSVYFAGDEYDAVQGAHALAIITPWNQFRNMDLRRIRSLLALPNFFDLRNIYREAEARGAGLRYFGVGKGTV
jgi:UDPglucose 6-dehydrogenase